MAVVLEFIKNIFRFHKMKIFLLSLFSFIFVILLFPLTEIGEKIVAEVNASGIVYLEFESMNLTFFPRPAVVMTEAHVEAPMIDSIDIRELRVAPSILALTQFLFTKKLKPYATVLANGFFQGQLTAQTSSSSKIKDPDALQVDLDYEGFDLKDLVKSLFPQSPVMPSASGVVKSKLDVDPTMKTQPEGVLELALDQLTFPQFDLPTAFGALSIPSMSFRKVIFKGQLKNGKLLLKEAQIGSNQDELFVKISGDVDVRIFPGGSPTVSYYSLAVDLSLKKSLQSKLGGTADALQAYLGKYSSATSEGQRFAFRIQGAGFNDPMPQISPL